MTHTIRLIRLKFIDTAEDEETWTLNVKKQWEGNNKIALRVLAGTKTVGITPPKLLQWYPFTGLSWETECLTGATFPVDFTLESPNVLFEVVGLGKPPGTVLGIVFWSAESFIGSNIQYTRQTLHVFRTGGGVAYKKPRDASTVHAVLEVEIQAMSPPNTPRKGPRRRSSVTSLPASTSAKEEEEEETQKGEPTNYENTNKNNNKNDSKGEIGVETNVHQKVEAEEKPADKSTSSSQQQGATTPTTTTTTPPSRLSLLRQSLSLGGSASSSSASTSVVSPAAQPQQAGGGGGAATSSSPTSRYLAANSHLTTDMPLSFTFGMVRTSVLDLYFPNLLLSEATTIGPSPPPPGGAASSSSAAPSPSSGSTSPNAPSSITRRFGSGGGASASSASIIPQQRSQSGNIIVSNIICVANMSEKVNLSMQLVARGAGGPDTAAALIFNPPGGVIVLPNQRAFFSVTWNSEKPLSSHLVEDVQLLLSGPDVSPAPVTFRVHFSDPKNNELYAPYHYWANGTLITNRPLNTHRELPFIRAVLPVFMVQQEMINAMGNMLGSAGGYGHTAAASVVGGGGGSCSGGVVGVGGGSFSGMGIGLGGFHQRQLSEYGFGSEYDLLESEDFLMVRDSDTGLHRRVVSSGAVGPALLPDGTRLHVGGGDSSGSQPTLSAQQQQQQLSLKMLSVRSWRREHARCTLRLGTLFGFPMITSSSTRGEGLAPSFKIMAQLLNNRHNPTSSGDKRNQNNINNGDGEDAKKTNAAHEEDCVEKDQNVFGWSFENGLEAETQEVYQTLSGSLRWSSEDKIALIKAPNATLTQFLRLTLLECSAVDRDETPIAAAIVSLPKDTASSLQPIPILVAFYVFDTFSLFDQLPTSSLVMRGASVKFSHLRKAPPAVPHHSSAATTQSQTTL